MMPQRGPCYVLMLNYTAQNLGQAFYHLGRVAGTGPGLIALHGNGYICVLAK